MTHSTTRALLRALIAAALAIPLWLSATPASPQEKPRKDADENKAKSQPGEDALTRALERRLGGKASLDDVMVDLRWRFEGDYTSVRIFGDGVGVWNHKVGFRISRAQARALIKKFASARFGSLPDSAGEEESRVLTGRILVSAGAVRKIVSQMADGAQSPVLSDLALSVLHAGKKASADGVRASSFEDGFAKQLSGKLGPGALDVHIVRKSHGGESAAPETWDLRIYGSYVYDREIGGAHGPDSTWQLRLPTAAFQALVRDLSAADIGTLPRNLYAPAYTDLDVTLLDQHRNIQAREFAGMTPQTHGEKQAAFDRLEKTLDALRERVLKEGHKVDAVDLLGPAREEHEREREDKDRDKDKDNYKDKDRD
jgi:hypothetical protein